MRRDLKKFLFLGAENNRARFFERAQKMGLIQFINSQPNKNNVTHTSIDRLNLAIKILRELPVTDQEENFSQLDSEKMVSEILALHAEVDDLSEEETLLATEIDRIANFGDFPIEDLAYIEKEGNRTVQFFTARTAIFENKPLPEGLIYITTEEGLDYFIGINPQPVSYEHTIEVKIERSLSSIQTRYRQVQDQLHNLHEALKKFSKYNSYLHHVLIEKMNEYSLLSTENYVQMAMEGKLFAIEGWIPDDHIDKVRVFCEELDVYFEEIAIEPSDTIPTYLENEGLGRMGEDLVNIYDTPSPTDKDPSLWVLLSFSLFFAIIVADAGYGLIYLAIALFCKYKFPNASKGIKRLLNMVTFISVACIIWGVMITSIFDIEVLPDNPIRKLSLIDWLAEKKVLYHIEHEDLTYQYWTKQYPKLRTIKDPHQFVYFTTEKGKQPVISRFADNVLFEMALFIGVLHLILSCLRYVGKNISLAGWAVFLAGGYLYFGAYLQQATFMNFVFGIPIHIGREIGFALLMGGLAFAWISAVFKHGLRGLEEGTKVIQIFADTLSYLRLYALGLAGAIVGATFNELASTMHIVFAVLLLFVAHSINLMLAAQSGLIHGLRLNFLEWYHYSFEGGGKKFQPLKLLKME